VWAQVKWPDGRPEEAAYVCQHCGVMLTEADKAEMLKAGEWRATQATRGIASFHISELYSPWSSWSEMAVAFVQAKRFPETLQTWINTSLGETFEDRGESVAPQGLASRREQYGPQTVPAGVVLLTAGVDVQDDRLEVSIWGWGRDEEAWLVEHAVLRGDPGSDALWLELDAFVAAKRSSEDGRRLLVEAVAVDSGGHFTQQVYGYAARRKARRVFAIKGAGGFGRLIWPKAAGRAGKTSAQVWIVGVDTAKDLLYGRLRRVLEPGPGYLHFCAAVEPEWFEQLTNEVIVHKSVQGRRVRAYKPRASGVRTEALDCMVYAYAAFLGRAGPRVLEHRKSAPVASEEVAEPKPEPVQPQQQATVVRRPQTMRRPGGYINSWR
jgi:phage terminase large subunit GpA-like protein